MSYYLAKLCYEIICGNGQHTPQFEEQIQILQNHNCKDAVEEAIQIGLREKLVLEPANRSKVEWKFLGVVELIPLHPMIHGAEVFQTHLEIAYAEGYRSLVQHKSNQLKANPEYASYTVSS